MRTNSRKLDSIAWTLVAISAFAISVPQPAHADTVTPPPVPANIQVPAGNTAFLVGHAVGTQNYICLPSGARRSPWTLFTPQATLFDDDDKQVITHFFSPNPAEKWHDSRHVAALAGHEHRLGRARSIMPPPTPLRRDGMPLPGSCSRWLEPKTDRPVATR